MKFLTQPCGNCPFRKDQAFNLHPMRALEITAALESDGHFICHKTTHLPSSDQAFCGGALRWLELHNKAAGNAVVRIAERVGLLPYPLPPAVSEIAPSRWHLAAGRGETDERAERRCIEEIEEEFFGYELDEDDWADAPRVLQNIREIQMERGDDERGYQDGDDDGDWE